MTPCSTGFIDVGPLHCDTIIMGFLMSLNWMGIEIANAAGSFMEDIFFPPEFSCENNVLREKSERGLSANSPLHSSHHSQSQQRTFLPLFILFEMILSHSLFLSYKDVLGKLGEIWETGGCANQFQSPLAVSWHPSLERKKSLKITPNLPLKGLAGQGKTVQTDHFFKNLRSCFTTL